MTTTYYMPGKIMLEEIIRRADGNTVFSDESGATVITSQAILEGMGYERDTV